MGSEWVHDLEVLLFVFQILDGIVWRLHFFRAWTTGNSGCGREMGGLFGARSWSDLNLSCGRKKGVRGMAEKRAMWMGRLELQVFQIDVTGEILTEGPAGRRDYWDVFWKNLERITRVIASCL
jgi:hypothetical protein